MASDLWDQKIATAVIEKKEKRRYLAYGLSGLATAALIVFAVVFTLQNKLDSTMQYSDFITLQVQGIHKSSLQKDVVSVSAGNSTSSGVLFSSAVDEVIEDAIY